MVVAVAAEFFSKFRTVLCEFCQESDLEKRPLEMKGHCSVCWFTQLSKD